MLLAMSEGVDGIVQFITVLLIFAVVLSITLLVTRWIGKFQKMQNYGRNVQVIESVRISPSAYVEILKVGNKYIAVAVSKDNVTYLCDVNPDDLQESAETSGNSFGNILEMVKNAIPDQNSGIRKENREDE